MPDNDLFRRSLDAGVAFTQLTRKRAEQIVRDLVKNGELSREQAAARVDELLERSRQNSEAILAIVRKEIDDRLSQLNLATRDDLTNLATRLGLPTGAKAKAPTADAGTGAQGGPAPAAPMAPGAPMAPAPPAKKAPVKAAKATKAPTPAKAATPVAKAAKSVKATKKA